MNRPHRGHNVLRDKIYKALHRCPLPTIVPFLVEAFDRCDPTRSHEAKPSERLRAQYQFRNAMRALALCTVIAAALLAITAICIH